MVFFPKELQTVVAAAVPLSLQSTKVLPGHVCAGEMMLLFSSVDGPQPQSAGLTSNSALPYFCL